MASELYDVSESVPEYFKGRKDFNLDKLKDSTTLYIGNLSYFIEETQIFELFSRVGSVKRVIMGLNKQTKTPCGFCFVEYFFRAEAENAVNLLNNTVLENRPIRVDWDTGFIEGRQFGRGLTGSQKRDEMMSKIDPDRPISNKFINLIDRDRFIKNKKERIEDPLNEYDNGFNKKRK